MATAPKFPCCADELRVASIRNRPETSHVAWPIGVGWTPSEPPPANRSLRRMETLTVAPGTGLPDGSRTRPTTNIRPGAGFSAGATGAWTTAGGLRGSSPLAIGRAR